MGVGTRSRLIGLAVIVIALSSAATAQARNYVISVTGDEFDVNPGVGCTLREAVESAQTNAAHGGCLAGEMVQDAITLEAGKTYKLTLTGNNDDDNLTGDLDLDAALNVNGNGATIDASAASDRIFDLRDATGSSQLFLDDVRLANGDSPSDGGAIRAGANPLNLIRGSFEGNHADTYGGAIRTTGSILATAIGFIGNTAGFDGGAIAIQGGTATIDRSTFADNHANPLTGHGGAIDTFSGGSTGLANSTVVGNSAAHGGGILFEATADQSMLHYDTIVGNADTAGAGGGGLEAETGRDAYVNRSILAANTNSSGASNCAGPGEIKYYTDAFNLESADTCGFNPAFDFIKINTDPQLAPLGSYGGETLTMPPFEGSPAVDAVPLARCAVFPYVTDQRNGPRPAGNGCDIGAVEGSVARPVTPATPPATASTTVAAPRKKRCKKKRKRHAASAKKKCKKKKK